MTPYLKDAIERLTCPECLGNGKLGNRNDERVGGVLFPQPFTTPCEPCKGTGIRRATAA